MNLTLFSLPSNAYETCLNSVMSIRKFFIRDEKSRNDELSLLPTDALVKILSYLPTDEIVRSARVSRSFKNLQKEPFLWKVLIERMCPGISEGIFQNLSLKDREDFAQTSIQIVKFNKGSSGLKKALQINKALLITTAIIQVPIFFHMLAALEESVLLGRIEAYMQTNPGATEEEARIAIIKAWEAIRDAPSIRSDVDYCY